MPLIILKIRDDLNPDECSDINLVEQLYRGQKK